MEARYLTLHVTIHRFAETYHVEVSHTDSGNHARVVPDRGTATIDTAALLPLQAAPLEYGEMLSRQLFSNDRVRERFHNVETAAQSTQSVLRISLCIDLSAQELQSLRWELLCHPETGAPLCTSETVLFSRLMVSRDFRPVKLRARSDLVALVAISAPPPEKLRRMELAPVDFAGEAARVEAALAGVRVRKLGGPGAPVTLERLVAELRDVDILYLVAHGRFGRGTGTPALILQDETGEARIVKGEDLAAHIGELYRGPRLVVLASCESGGDGEHTPTRTTVQATLAARLADAGVPAILAMQGEISMATVEKMMPVFFRELLRDGQIDRAVAVARGRVRQRADWWVPALYTRLSNGCVWYTPGFRGGKGEEVWRRLLTPIRRGKVVPILGPRLLEAAHGASHDTALRLAGANHFPFAVHEWDDLPRVTEYMLVKESRYNVIQAYQKQLLADLIEQHRQWLPPKEIPPQTPQPRLGRLLALVGDRLRENPADPYRILAELPGSVYVTTNFDPLLERALKANRREPQQVLTRWRHQKAPRSAAEQPISEPTAMAPLVYHVFGAFGPHVFGAFGANSEDGLVLTEDDHFDYLIDTAAGRLIPPQVESALVDNSLLFLGFRLTDWHFRVLFRLMMNLPGRERLKQYCHVAVQLDPDMQTMADVEGAKQYLAKYFGKEANIDIYWGSAEEFLKRLRDELATAGELSVDNASGGEDDDEWNF
jgi:hypothetical protein